MSISRQGMANYWQNACGVLGMAIYAMVFGAAALFCTFLLVSFGLVAIIAFWFCPSLMIAFDSWCEQLEKEDNEHFTGLIL